MLLILFLYHESILSKLTRFPLQYAGVCPYTKNKSKMLIYFNVILIFIQTNPLQIKFWGKKPSDYSVIKMDFF